MTQRAQMHSALQPRHRGFSVKKNGETHMKNFLFFTLTLTLFAAPSFAIDQVILKNGQVVEGKILNDVPNRHVDIELVNGGNKRFNQSEVASVERDVPSTQDQNMYGNQSRLSFGLLGGAFIQSMGTQKKVQFDYGAQINVTAGSMGDFGKFSMGLAYTRTSRTYDTIPSLSLNTNEIMLQFLVSRLGNGGFYFGPQAGILVASANISGAATQPDSITDFDLGAVAGYDVFMTPNFSVGPQVSYSHVFDSTAQNNFFKFLIALTYHF